LEIISRGGKPGQEGKNKKMSKNQNLDGKLQKNRIKGKSNPVARDLFTARYKPRVVKNKKKYRREDVIKKINFAVEEDSS
jgi:hypothetical protein